MKPFWDVEENKGFVKVRSPIDNMEYKVYSTGNPQLELEVANKLAECRFMINKTLLYLIKNKDLWMNESIAFGMLHTFDIHIPCWVECHDIIMNSTIDRRLSNLVNQRCLDMNKLYNMQEMTPNKHGIVGLNKPKKIIKIKKFNNYEMAEIRSMHLTIRNDALQKIKSDKFLQDLVFHELTHTTCNDIYWKDDNHKYPFEKYHKMIKNWYLKSF